MKAVRPEDVASLAPAFPGDQIDIRSWALINAQRIGLAGKLIPIEFEAQHAERVDRGVEAHRNTRAVIRQFPFEPRPIEEALKFRQRL